jgi:hypothetical protein
VEEVLADNGDDESERRRRPDFAANTSSHTRNCAENSDCSPTTRNIQLVKDCVVDLRSSGLVNKRCSV